MEEHEAFDRARLDIAIRQQAEEAQHQALIDGGNAQLAAYQKVGLRIRSVTPTSSKTPSHAATRECSVRSRQKRRRSRTQQLGVGEGSSHASSHAGATRTSRSAAERGTRTSAECRRIPDAKGIHGTTPRPLAPSRGGSEPPRLEQRTSLVFAPHRHCRPAFGSSHGKGVGTMLQGPESDNSSSGSGVH